jgi:pimeloyl-ACP methyl ester carboxylesterase
MELLPWSYTTREGFTVRGWHSPPSGRPILHVLHGNGFCCRTYEPLLAALNYNFDLWLSDVQGHGDSEVGERFVGWNRNADIALEAFKHHRHLFGEVPALALGHSFGGVLTCLIMGSQQKLFSRAVLLDPVIFPPAMALAITMAEGLGLAGQSPLAKAALKRRQHWPTRTEAADSLRGRGTYKGWQEAALQAFVQHALKDTPQGQVALKCPPEREAKIFGSAPTGLWTALRMVRTPTLLMHGQHTLDFIPKSAQEWVACNPAVLVRQVPGGHCFMQEHPESTALAVREFLLDGK